MSKSIILLLCCFLVSETQGRGPYDMVDLGEFFSHWLDTNCGPPNWCDEFDMDRDRGVGLGDYGLFTTEWQMTCTNDSDCDSLSDGDESTQGTNASDPDSDGDGLLDGEEVNPNQRTGSTLSTIRDASGNPITSITFSAGGKETVYVEAPVWNDALEYIAGATLTLTGQSNGGSFPSNVLLDVGGDWAGFDTIKTHLLDWQKSLIQVNSGARSSSVALAGEDGIGQQFQVLKTNDIRGFAIFMEFFTAGDYYYGIQDSSGNWLSGFPETLTVSAATGGPEMIQFPFSTNTTLTRGTDYILAVVEKTDLGFAPFGYAEQVNNPYPYGGFLFGADSSNAGGWDMQNSPANSDLAFHLFTDFTGSETTYDLSAGFNLYLTSYNGPYLNQVTIPIDIYSTTAGTINFSNVAIQLNIVTTDPTSSDTDGDGLKDGWDDADGDQVYDLTETKGERQYATHPGAADTDGDGQGLNDLQEINNSYDMTLPTGGSSSHISNPLRPDFLVEVDAMTGFAPGDVRMFETQAAYEELGITLRYKIDQTNVTPATVSSNSQEESTLSASKNYTDYAHLFIAGTNGGTSHGTTHYASPNQTMGSVTHGNTPSPVYAGSFVFQQNINSDYTNHQSEFSPVGITLDLLSARTIIHELGHIVGCMHEGSVDGWNYANVMIQNSALGDPASTIDRWIPNVLGTAGNGSRFSTASVAQMDLSFKPSVETGLDPKNRRFDFGTTTSNIYTGNLQVLITDNYSETLRFGWVPNAAPNSASLNGGANGNDLYDIVEHTIDGSPVQFGVGGLGQAKLTVRVYMGKGRLIPLTADFTVHARVFGQVSTNYESTVINNDADHKDSDSLYLDWPNYPVPFEDGSMIIDFTDDASTAPAPIEYLRVTKRDV